MYRSHVFQFLNAGLQACFFYHNLFLSFLLFLGKKFFLMLHHVNSLLLHLIIQLNPFRMLLHLLVHIFYTIFGVKLLLLFAHEHSFQVLLILILLHLGTREFPQLLLCLQINTLFKIGIRLVIFLLIGIIPLKNLHTLLFLIVLLLCFGLKFFLTFALDCIKSGLLFHTESKLCLEHG